MAAEPLIASYAHAVERVLDETEDVRGEITIFNEANIDGTVQRIVQAVGAAAGSERDRRSAERQASYHLGLFMQWHGIDIISTLDT